MPTANASPRRPLWKIMAYTAACLVLLAIILPVASRRYMRATARSRVYTDISRVPECRVALVLGAAVRRNGNLSTCLSDRCNAAIALYKAGRVKKLLMSGDNSTMTYDEPTAMAAYAVAHGVPAEDVVLDYAGRRTYDSIYRARHIFGLREFVVVSQSFHLDRALFLSRRFGVEAYGASADVRNHDNTRWAMREYAACVSALLDAYILHPKPILGRKEKI